MSCRASQGPLLGDYRIVQRLFFTLSVLRANRHKPPNSRIWAAATSPSPRCEIFDSAPKCHTYHKVMQHSPTTQGSAHLPEKHVRAPLVPPPSTTARPLAAATQNVLCADRAHRMFCWGGGAHHAVRPPTVIRFTEGSESEKDLLGTRSSRGTRNAVSAGPMLVAERVVPARELVARPDTRVTRRHNSRLPRVALWRRAGPQLLGHSPWPLFSARHQPGGALVSGASRL